MNVIVNGRHLEITPALKNYSIDKMSKFEKYLSNINETIVTLSVEKYRHKAEVLMKVNGYMIQAESVTGEIYSSIDEVVEKLEKQVVKYKEKLQTFRKSDKSDKKAAGAPDEKKESTGNIIKHKKFDMKPMSAEEAVDQMDLLDKSFFIFANRTTGDINVVYRRGDGNFGLIEPVK
ncbi:MAG TPA: ribosome-associated translation inhibitor RaiA [Dissulfurispiraceae bacterium]|nr:ribosome-associated translation inhibitor RaiA [Dissulfurispiraceae bacterium]